jgi:hypothetical protein
VALPPHSHQQPGAGCKFGGMAEKGGGVRIVVN